MPPGIMISGSRMETTLDGMEPLLTEEKIKQVRAVPGVKSVRIVSSADIVVPLQEEVFRGLLSGFVPVEIQSGKL